MTIMETGTVLEELLRSYILVNKREAEKGRLCHSDIPPPTRLQLVTLPKHQQRPKYSNIWIYRVHSSSNHHTNWLKWWVSDPSESSPSMFTPSWPGITVTCCHRGLYGSGRFHLSPHAFSASAGISVLTPQMSFSLYQTTNVFPI